MDTKEIEDKKLNELDENQETKKNKNKKFKKIIAALSITVFGIVLIILMAVLLPGSISKSDKGIMFKQFGVAAKDKWVTRKGDTYYFGKDGYAFTGWKKIDKSSYFFAKNGVMQKGWIDKNGKKYYLDKETGKLIKGFYTIKDDNYYFDEKDGSLQKGVILKDDNIIAYSNDEGKLLSGVYEIEGVLRCFSETGESKIGWVELGGDKFYCNADGRAAVGNSEIEGNRYFFDDKGILKKGWIEDSDGNKYYSDEEGILQTGRQNIDGKYYYFDDASILKTGWINIDNSERSYADENGVLKTGKQNISGIEFTFDDKGILVNQNSGELKMVALTFDDGPSANTDKILDVLESFDCKATFFVVGSRVSSYPSQIKREYELGCEIGSHTFNHKYLTSLSSEEMQNELDRTNEAVSKVIGRGTTCVRPPGGFYNDDVKSRIDIPIVMWSIDTEDWKTKNTQSVAQIATTGIQDGDIILMHDLYSSTADAVEMIVPALISQGFQIVTVQELLDAHGGAFGNKVYFTANEVK